MNDAVSAVKRKVARALEIRFGNPNDCGEHGDEYAAFAAMVVDDVTAALTRSEGGVPPNGELQPHDTVPMLYERVETWKNEAGRCQEILRKVGALEICDLPQEFVAALVDALYGDQHRAVLKYWGEVFRGERPRPPTMNTAQEPPEAGGQGE